MNALRDVIELDLGPPCAAMAPLLHRLVDGELAPARERRAREHLRLCDPCRSHVALLELEEQALRELAAPSPRRFVALWSERLKEKLARVAAMERRNVARDGSVDHSADGKPGSETTRSSRSTVRSPDRKRTV